MRQDLRMHPSMMGKPLAGNAARNIRYGMGGAMGLMALSQGQKTLESLRRGQIGQTAMHAGIMAGAGYAAYHTLYRTPQFTNAMNLSRDWLMKRSGMMTNKQAGMGVRNIANLINKIK